MMKVCQLFLLKNRNLKIKKNLTDTSNEDVPTAAPEQLPDGAKNELVKMASWLLDNGRDEYLTVYGKMRGGVLQRSLNSLRNHQRSVSGGSTHGSGAIGSPMLVSVNH